MTDRRKQWERVHQPYELAYHRQGNYRWPGRESLWDEQWEAVFATFGDLTPTTFEIGACLADIGCGSRPALQWFTQDYDLYCLDPLLDDFRVIPQMADFWNDPRIVAKESRPAEELVESMAGKMDLVLCWNVLDHTFDWRKIVTNLHAYVSADGVVLLGTDTGERESKGHPGIVGGRNALLEYVGKLFRTEKAEYNVAHRQVCLKLRKR